MINVIWNILVCGLGTRAKSAWCVKLCVQLPCTREGYGRQRRHDQSYFRPEWLRETRNFSVRAKVRAIRTRGGTNGMVFTNANKHSYQLQNDSRPAGAQSAYRPCRTTAVVATPTPPVLFAFSTPNVLNFWSPASPCNLEEDPVAIRPFSLSFLLVRLCKYLTLEIQWGKRSEVTICTNHEGTILPLQNRIARRWMR